ncbi:hypothetical protein Tco_1516926 [Tanacetum coccineum]
MGANGIGTSCKKPLLLPRQGCGKRGGLGYIDKPIFRVLFKLSIGSGGNQWRSSSSDNPIPGNEVCELQSVYDLVSPWEDEDAQDMGRTRYVLHEEKESAKKEVSTEDALSTDKQKFSIDKEEFGADRPDEGTDKQKVSTDKEEVSTDKPDEGTVDQTEGRSATLTTPTPTPTIIGDDETIAQVLLNMSQAKAVSREKEKGVELKDVENTERPRPTLTRSLLTLKPLPKIEEDKSNTESKDINESEKKFKTLSHDEEIARKMQEDWEAEEERKRLAEEEATNATFIQDFDDIKARIEAHRLLAIRRFLAEQRAAAIRNRPSTDTQLISRDDDLLETYCEVSSEETLSCEPMVSSLNDEIDFRVSFDDSDDEDYTGRGTNDVYFNDLFPFNIIHFDDLKSEKDNDDNDIDILLSSEDMALPSHAERAQADSARQIPDKGDLRDYWIGISSARDFLGITPSYTATRDPILKLCHRLISCSIFRRTQAPEKVTVTDLFYLRGMDICSINVPYLLVRYWRLFAAGRKSGAHISGRQFVARLAEHFGLQTREILGGLTVIAFELLIIDMAELVRLHICMEVDDTWDWVAMGPERQLDAAAGAPVVAQDALLLMRVARLIRHLHRHHHHHQLLPGLCHRGWLVKGGWMMDKAGVTYTSYSETPREYTRHVRHKTSQASTSTAQQVPHQPDP